MRLVEEDLNSAEELESIEVNLEVWSELAKFEFGLKRVTMSLFVPKKPCSWAVRYMDMGDIPTWRKGNQLENVKQH